MALPIEDYGIIGDLHTAALVGRDGSIDWLCLPRFDSAACFAELLGDEDNGRWKIAPKGSRGATHRHYRGDTLVLESEFVTDEGTVRVVDCMPIRQEHPEVIRLVEGVRGKVDDGDGADHPLRLRPDRSVGPADRRDRSPPSPAPTPSRCAPRSRPKDATSRRWPSSPSPRGSTSRSR